MKRSSVAVSNSEPDKLKPVKYQPFGDEDEESEENETEPPASNLVPARPPTGTGGKQPNTTATAAAAAAAAAGGKPLPGRPTTAGKQPNTTTTAKPGAAAGGQTGTPGTGGKQPDLSPQKIAAMKQRNPPASGNNNAANAGKAQSNTAGKGPVSYSPSNSSRPPSGSQTQPRTGTGGKEPQHTQSRYQTSSHLSKAQSSLNKARPQTNRKQHPLIGKTVKVYYVPEGYYTGVVRSHLGGFEFMISWDDASHTTATLREEDETEDIDNEDRWSVVEDLEEKPAGNGTAASKQQTKQQQQQQTIAPPPKKPQQAPPPPPQKPTKSNYDEDEEDNEENEQDNEDPDDNDT